MSLGLGMKTLMYLWAVTMAPWYVNCSFILRKLASITKTSNKGLYSDDDRPEIFYNISKPENERREKKTVKHLKGVVNHHRVQLYKYTH